MTIEVEIKRVECFLCREVVTVKRKSKMQFTGDCSNCGTRTVLLVNPLEG